MQLHPIQPRQFLGLQNSMKAVFITEANQKIGLGHLKRCCALALELKIDNIVDVEIILPEVNEENSKILEQEKIIYFNFMDRVDFLRNLNTHELFFIVDVKSIFYDRFIQEFASKDVKIFGIDDFTHRNLNYTANFAPPTSVVPENFKDLQRDYNFIGWDWVPIQNELWAADNLQKTKKNNILLLFGGSDADRLSIPSCKHFTQNMEKNQFTLVGGPLMLENDFSVCQLIANESMNLSVTKSPANLFHLMSKNRFSITSFGHTFYELIALRNYPLGIYRSDLEVEGLLSSDNSLDDYLISLDEYKNLLEKDLKSEAIEFWGARFDTLNEKNQFLEELSHKLHLGCSNIKNVIYNAI